MVSDRDAGATWMMCPAAVTAADMRKPPSWWPGFAGAAQPGSASSPVLAGRGALPSRHWPHSGCPAGPYTVLPGPQPERWPVTGRRLSGGPVATTSTGP